MAQNNETPSVTSAPVETEDSILKQLKQVIARKVERHDVFIDVPERSGVKLLVSPNVTQQQLRAWQKQNGGDSPKGMDSTRFACTVVGQTTKGIFFNGNEAQDDGWPLTFASASVLEMTGTVKAIPDCVQKFFGLDAHVEAAALAIIEACGFGDTITAESSENPTK